MKRELNKKKTIKVVTANDFITARGLESLSLNSRKLLYLTISQCQKNDKEFYEYNIPIKDFAELMGIDDSNLYKQAKKITGNLLSLVLECSLNKKDYDQYAVFSKCSYRAKTGLINIQLNPAMTDFLLNIRKDFTQPLLEDFVRMKSSFSMAIWHLMQREMKSRKPGVTQAIAFDLSLEELRKVTGTENKMKQIGQFREKVLDKALREIHDNCSISIDYEDLKISRKIVGFRFYATNDFHIDENSIPESIKQRVQETKQRIDKKK